MEEYTLIHILSGSGGIQVDFKSYYDWQEKAIFLEKGQYIKFLSEGFTVRKIEFPNEDIFHNKEVRVLFKHLISLGYIDFEDCEDCKRYVSDTVLATKTNKIIDISSKQWFWQNPFHANELEYQVIFDIKDVIDEQYSNHLTTADLVGLISGVGYNAQALVQDKVGLTVKALLARKRLVESQKEIAFTDKSIQEIAYDLGYKDPAYFNRVFKKEIGQTPASFRKEFDYANRDVFVQNLIELLRNFHSSERSLAFYADKMNLSVKTLEKKVRTKLNASMGNLIRMELLNTAKKMLDESASVKETAFALGFEEANHFTSFFKRYIGTPPSAYKNKKYNS